MVNLALIGCGYWGKNYVRTLRDLDGVKLEHVVDLNKPGIRIPGETKFTSSVDEVLKDKGIKGVIVATPTATHYELAKRVLENGKSVLVEKPITTDFNQAQELCRLAETRKVQLMVGEIFRFNNALRYVKAAVENGDIGELRYIESRRIGLGPIRTDVSVLWDLATHDIYISNWIVGKSPSSVTCFGISHNGSLDDITSLNLKYTDPEVLSTIYVNWEHPIKERKIFFGGTKKAVLFDDVEPSDKIRVYDKGVDYQSSSGEFGEFIASTRDGDIVIPKLKLAAPLEEQLRNFAASIEGKDRCLSDGYTCSETVRVLQAAEESRRNYGKEVRL